ncbi:hypothetical protein PTTG_27248 [Puccinia triticina 1-1 BBBD Race 1]|uniref:Uncharacterized protein n=1 Tax=Puccinia triticina (isolate 1-1 / race 1 (BBBD)) TaxID=630390 RepID=A0A180GNZ4_PUCT1|nr:hypothetical protein PTTG_27248 [Puccinia triticina 1-1 BBBD Race 1]
MCLSCRENSGGDQMGGAGLASNHPGPVSQNLLLTHEAIGAQIKQLKDSFTMDGQGELKNVADHLEQLHNYLTPGGKTAPAALKDARNPIEALFKPRSSASSDLSLMQRIKNPLARVGQGSHALASVTRDPLEGISNQVIPIWKYLQERFITLKCQDLEEPETKLDYLKSLFLLGDYIHSKNLLPPADINAVEIFQPKTVVSLVNFHVNLVMKSKGTKFFGGPEWINPEYELMLSNPSLSHFHRSIKALPEEQKKPLVYLTLSSIIIQRKLMLPWLSMEEEFFPICTEFLNGNFATYEGSRYFLVPKDQIKYPKSLDYRKPMYEFVTDEPWRLEALPPTNAVPRVNRDSYQLLTLNSIANFFNTYVESFVAPKRTVQQMELLVPLKFQYISALQELAQNGFKDSKLKKAVTNQEKLLLDASGLTREMKESTKRWIKHVYSLVYKTRN